VSLGPRRVGAKGQVALGESLLAAASSDVALPAGGVILEFHRLRALSLGENPVHLGRATAVPLASCPLEASFLRPASTVAIPTHCHGCPGCSDTSVMRRAGMGLPPSCRR
jgi:hypothetical protein